MTNRAHRNVAPAKQPSPIKKDTLSVVILAAKMGHRMKSRGPKCLFNLRDDLTILDTQLQSVWSKYPNADVIIVADFQYEKIRDYVQYRYPARVVINPHHEQRGMMHGVSIGVQATASQNLLIMYGDLVVAPDALNLLGKASAIQNTKFNQNQRPDDEIGVAIGDNLNITNLAYGLPYKWCQMAYFTGKEFELLRDLAFSNKTTNWMLHEGLNAIINDGGNFISYAVPNTAIVDVDSVEDLEKARKFYD